MTTLHKKLAGLLIFMAFFAVFPVVVEHTYIAWKVFILEQKTPEEFVFYRQPVDSVYDVYDIGQNPEFNFIKTYYVSGPINGENVLRCDGFRSDVFVGSGFVTPNQLNRQINIAEQPFVWGGNLPDFPTECTMRSIITLCEEQYGVCKTVTTDSEVIRFE